MITFASSLSQRVYSYAAWKTAWTARGGRPQCDGENGDYWILWFYDGPEVHLAKVWMAALADDVAASYPGGQSQATADLADFVAAVQPQCNAVLEPKAANGRLQTVQTITKYTTDFRMRVFSFQTSTPASLHNASPTAPMADAAYKCFDLHGVDVTAGDLTTAVRTQLDFEAAYAFEVVGGWMDVPDETHASVVSAGPGLWFISTIGVPDVPFAYGGSKPFADEIDIALIPSGQQRIELNAVAVSYLKPGPYHTNKIRWTIRHPAGGAEWFQIFARTFV